MPSKRKPPARPASVRNPAPRVAAVRPQRPQADSRWQRTVRYGWDKGGARGGRK